MHLPFPLFKDSLHSRAAVVVVITSMAAAGGLVLGDWLGATWQLSIIAAMLAGSIATRLLISPIAGRLRALANAVDGLADGDFAIAVTRGGGEEINALIKAFNDTTAVMRRERLALHQRELLLDTVVQSSPIAMALLDERQRVMYANVGARRLLNNGHPIQGIHWQELASRQTPAAAEALGKFRHGIFEVADESKERERYMLRSKLFLLNSREHRLVLLERLTRELNRQEVANWKKVIRVISHELNNSVAPISSLLHSGRQLSERGDHERLRDVLRMTADRTAQLKNFIDRYAGFARLPAPEIKSIHWEDLLDSVRVATAFQFNSEVSDEPLHADRAQIEQVLINLLRNAHQSGSDPGDITLTIASSATYWHLTVADRGQGMSDQVMAHALIPFYSTRADGSGIGLALSREIVEAHLGQIQIRNRIKGGLAVSFSLPKHAQPSIDSSVH
jgi:nitrogen fixation/metabolism regulation signal transduction histidine kinase